MTKLRETFQDKKNILTLSNKLIGFALKNSIILQVKPYLAKLHEYIYNT